MKRYIFDFGKKVTAIVLQAAFACQLFCPNIAMALTTGPSQPEVQGFEPVGMTDMVDMFSGDFTYNIPLVDIEGYPVNISYHGGVGMEQEASWVGLGWNINPGTINRTVRGLPDDFNGDTVYKDFNIKPENTLKVGVGNEVEVMGMGDPNLIASKHLKGSVGWGYNLTYSNYRGFSLDLSASSNIKFGKFVSAGINLGVGSQTGASIDYSAGFSVSASKIMNKDMASYANLNASIGGGYSSRSGLRDLNLSFGTSQAGGHLSVSTGFDIPISLKNYVPTITNSSNSNSFTGRLKFGSEAFGGYMAGNVNASFSRLTYSNDASRNTYGYLYLQNAGIRNAAVLDFSRDKDGMFNRTMQYLPVPSMTYDVYSITGQGTGGMYRAQRNDIGNVYDPYTISRSANESGMVEGGVGNAFEAGWDFTHSNTEIFSGPWRDYQRFGTLSKGFTSKKEGSVFENVYFKESGVYAATNLGITIDGSKAISPEEAMNLPQVRAGSLNERSPRTNLLYFHTAKEATDTGVATSPDIISVNDTDFNDYGAPSVQSIKRVGSGNFQRKKDQISEFVQVQKDGKKYVYSIPALNNVQKEVTFSVDPTAGNAVNLNSGTVSFSSTDASHNNTKCRDHYFNSSVTPAYVHSYLLTSVLSPDYVDVTGNGPSDDDLGSYTKFSYTRTDSDYRWVAPYSANINTAQYSPGFWSDPLDDKASFVCGSREQWYLHSIESKNYIAEFYTSRRHDAHGIVGQVFNTVGGGVLNSPKSTPSVSYKLDSIKTFNKHDRFINGAQAIPIKTVFFVYNYSLCANVLNSDPGYGKLTLSKLYFRYGNSQKSMISPY